MSKLIKRYLNPDSGIKLREIIYDSPTEMEPTITPDGIVTFDKPAESKYTYKSLSGIYRDNYDNSPSYTPMNLITGNVTDYWQDYWGNKAGGKVANGMSNAAPTVFSLLSVPSMLTGAIAAPATTIAGLVGGYYGGKLGRKIGTKLDPGNWYYGDDIGEGLGNITGGLLAGSVGGMIDNPIPVVRTIAQTPVGKRTVEMAMRSGGAQDGLQNMLFKNLPIRLKLAILKYALSGKRTLLPNSTEYYPRTFRPADVPEYQGLTDVKPLEIQEGYGDMIDAYLYGKTLDPRLGKRIGTGENFGILNPYILKNYFSKANNIPVYEVPGSGKEGPIPDNYFKATPKGAESGFYIDAIKNGIDVAGHLYLTGVDESLIKAYLNKKYADFTESGKKMMIDSELATFRQNPEKYCITNDIPHITRSSDIWKFNPKDYIKKWFDGKISLVKRLGLEAADAAGTPIVTHQNAEFNPGSLKSDFIEDKDGVIFDVPKFEIPEDFSEITKNILTQPVKLSR